MEARNGIGQPCQGVALDYGDSGDADANRDTTATVATVPAGADARITDANGRVTFTRAARAAATYNWRVWADLNPDNDTFDGGEANLTGSYVVYTAAATTLDCTPDADTNPATDDPNTAGTQNEHTITCTLRDQQGTIFGDRIDGEFDGGPNDPGAGGVDIDDCGGTSGTCTYTYTNAGTATTDHVCFWHDSNNDNVHNYGGGVEDGGGCPGENDPTPDDADLTDRVTKQWDDRVATTLDVTPESDTNNVGDPHNMTATVTDQFGAAVSGANVDFKITAGPHATGGDTRQFECTTNGVGQCTGTYTGTANGTDNICAWVDDDGDNVFQEPNQNDGGNCDTESNTVGSDAPADRTDRVQKTYGGAAGAPVRIDCVPETDSNQTGQNHAVTCTVRDGNNIPVPNVSVDVEATGAGDPDGANSPQSPDFGGNTDANGEFTFNHISNTRGTTNYRAWIDADNNPATDNGDATEGQDETTTPGGTPEGPSGDNTDVVSKLWTGPPFALTMTPDTDSAAVGTCNAFTITVTDSDGTPVAAATVDVTQNYDSNATANEATVGFCNPGAGSGPNPQAGTGNLNTGPADADSETANAEYTTNGTGQVTIGVTSTLPGTVDIRAFVDLGADNDTFLAGEPTDTSVKTWTAGGGDSVTTLDAEPETDSNPDGTNHSITVTLKNTAGNPLENVSPNASVVAGPNTGTNLSCTISNAQGVSVCTYNGDDVPNSPTGTDTIRAWVNQSTGGTPGPDASEPQDDVSKTWTARPTGLQIDLTCQGEGTGDDLDVGERGTNDFFFDVDCRNPLSDNTVRFQAKVVNPGADPAAFDDQPIAGQQVEFVIENDATTNGAVFTGDGLGPVYCTTQADGTCSVEVTVTNPQDFDQVRVRADLFGQTNNGAQGNNFDDATKQWEARRTDSIDVTPDADTNPVLTQHTVTITATDQFGDPRVGENIDVRVTGRNVRAQNDLFTNAQGQASFNYTDSGPAGSDGSDDIEAWADNANENDTLDGGEPSDVARKDWRVNVPPVDQVQQDMDNCDADPTNPTDPEWENTTPANPVNQSHEVCATAFDVNGDPIIGTDITFTLSGPGHFTNAQGTSDLGTSVTVPMGNDDRSHVFIVSAQSGTTTVTATANGKTDTGTKVWSALDGRTIDCVPTTATNEPGTDHNIDCLVLDRQGNEVVNTPVVFQLTGAGVIQNPACFNQQQTICVINTDSNGVARLTIKSDTEGTSTVTATLEEDTQGEPDTDECDRVANDPSGAPAGNCADTVTKTWANAAAQCDDDLDNDGDGFIDFNGGPAGEDNDPGCDSAADDSENPFNPGSNTVEHTRTAKITKFKHIKQGGKKSLLIKGTVETDDGETLCSASVPVKVQFRAGGEWITKKSDTTSNSDGDGDGAYIFKVSVQDVVAKYRVVAVKHQVQDPNDATTVHVCKKAIHEKRHKHN